MSTSDYLAPSLERNNTSKDDDIDISVEELKEEIQV
jgi:hypothetical protein